MKNKNKKSRLSMALAVIMTASTTMPALATEVPKIAIIEENTIPENVPVSPENVELSDIIENNETLGQVIDENLIEEINNEEIITLEKVVGAVERAETVEEVVDALEEVIEAIEKTIAENLTIELSAELTVELATEVTEEVTTEITKEAVAGVITGVAEEVITEVVTGVAVEVATEVVEEVVTEVVEEVVTEVTEEVVTEVTEEWVTGVTEEVVTEVTGRGNRKPVCTETQCGKAAVQRFSSAFKMKKKVM